MSSHFSQEITNPDARFEAARDWSLAQLAGVEPVFSIASADASFRRYFRLRDPQTGRRWILMDAPPEREKSAPFIDIAARLRRAGLNAPEVLAADLERGFLLLTDLGEHTLLQATTPETADRWMQQAVETLVTMQAAVSATGLPPYDETLLQRELDLYPGWYLARHREHRFDPAERAVWETACARLIESARAQAQLFVHRDYMPRNLMATDPPGVLDFQDAVCGPVTYDVVSLFRDAFVSWPQADIERWLALYRRRAAATGIALPDDFERAFDWMGMQRHIKVIGIFARLHYRDGKARYLAETPRFFRYLYEIGGKYPEFAPLLELMRKYERET